MSLGDILVSALLILVVGCVIYSMVKRKKAGQPSCGGDCGSCPGCAARGAAGVGEKKH